MPLSHHCSREAVRDLLARSGVDIRRLFEPPAPPRAPWTFERVCLLISTTCSVLCVLGFAWLVSGR